MPGRLGLGQRVLDRVRVRDRDREAVDLLGDGGVDQLRLLLRVVVGRAPDELDALVLGRLLGALLDDRPERALVAVRDHRDREAAALRQVDALRAAAGRRGRPARAVGLVARRHRTPATTSAASARTATSTAGAVASSVGHLSLRGARCGQELDALAHIERRTAAGRGLRAGDRDVLLEHEPALVPGLRRGGATTSSIRASPSPSGRNSPACVA